MTKLSYFTDIELPHGVWKQQHYFAGLLEAHKNGELAIPDYLLTVLRDFQIGGVMYAAKAKRCFIADEMGLGKTLEAIATVDTLKAYPVLVICPTSVKLNWQNEWNKWIPGKKIQILSGSSIANLLKRSSIRKDTEIVIINYDVLDNYFEDIEKAGFKAVILDESHYVKSAGARRTGFVNKICIGMEYIFMLTGTPILNRPGELVTQLKILRHLERFGGELGFVRKYCTTGYGGKIIGGKNLDYLNEHMRSFCYIRRNKKDVLKDLPDKQRTNLQVEIANRKEYDSAEEDLVKFVHEKALHDEKFDASLAGLRVEERILRRQTYADSKAVKAMNAMGLVKIEVLKQVAAKGKLIPLFEWIEDFLENEDKLVVFADHIDIQKTIIERFPDNTTHLFGEDSIEVRDANVKKFQTDPNCKMIVCSLKAGGLGITLTAASTVVMVEQGWNPAIHDQAEDRLHRIGQKESVNVYYFLGKNTIDEDIRELIERKRAVVTATLEGKEPDKQISIYQELIDRITRRRK